MNNRNVIIAVAAVVVLAFYFFGFQSDSGTEDGATPAPAATTEGGG